MIFVLFLRVGFDEYGIHKYLQRHDEVCKEMKAKEVRTRAVTGLAVLQSTPKPCI